jgi:ADP-ribose pyrophosphatase
MNKWKILARNTVYKSGIFKIESLQCHHEHKGVTHDFFVLNTQDWINIIALTGDDRLIMVEQHRLGTDEYTIETSAGLIEPGEQPEEAARRELLEETGFEPSELVLLKKCSSNPAIMNNYIHFYLATGCRKSATQNLDPAEDIDVHLYTHDEVFDLLKRGRINHSIIITALSLYFLSPHFRRKGAISLF